MSIDDPDLFPEPTDQPTTDEPPSEPAGDRLLDAETGDPDTYPDESVRDAAREPVGADKPIVKIAELQEQSREFDDQTAEVDDSVTIVGLPPEPAEAEAYVEQPPPAAKQEQPPTSVGPVEAAALVAPGLIALGKGGLDKLREARADRATREDVEDDDRPRS